MRSTNFFRWRLAYERANTPSLEGFLHWVERGGAEIKRDMERGRDEVRVMTVHGAKGLEADIVILPDTTSLPEPSGAPRAIFCIRTMACCFPCADAEAPQSVTRPSSPRSAKRCSEHRRLLYVALTRARDRLYVCGFENKNGIKDGSWYTLAERAAKRSASKFARRRRIHGVWRSRARPLPRRDAASARKTSPRRPGR